MSVRFVGVWMGRRLVGWAGCGGSWLVARGCPSAPMGRTGGAGLVDRGGVSGVLLGAAGAGDEAGGVAGDLGGEVGEDVGVGVGGDHDRGVAEEFLDCFEVGAGGEGEGGGAVAEAADGDGGRSASWMRVWKRLVRCSGWMGVPSGWVNARPLFGRVVPAASRLACWRVRQAFRTARVSGPREMTRSPASDFGLASWVA